MPSLWMYRSRFRLVECPVPRCAFGRGGRPLWGTLPGIKRHVRLVHGEFAYAHVVWCSIYTWEGSPWGEELRLGTREGREYLTSLTFRELRARARVRGVTQSGKSKAQLVEAIHRTYGLRTEESRRAFGSGAESKKMRPVYGATLQYNPFQVVRTSRGSRGGLSALGQRRDKCRAYPKYATMRCPVGCLSKGGIGPMTATVPGMKRHVLRVHGRMFADAVTWPPLYVDSTSAAADWLRASKVHPPKPYEEMTVKELRAAAKRRGVPQFGKNKADFIEALTTQGEAPAGTRGA